MPSATQMGSFVVIWYGVFITAKCIFFSLSEGDLKVSSNSSKPPGAKIYIMIFCRGVARYYVRGRVCLAVDLSSLHVRLVYHASKQLCLSFPRNYPDLISEGFVLFGQVESSSNSPDSIAGILQAGEHAVFRCLQAPRAFTRVPASFVGQWQARTSSVSLYSHKCTAWIWYK